MSDLMLSGLRAALKRGELIPVLGAGIFEGAHDRSGTPLPFDSHSLILALNNNRPMPPRLMLEYPRAAMQIEQRRGRSVLEGLFSRIYDAGFEPLPIQRVIADLMPPVVVDLNRDGGVQELYSSFDHTLLVGTARIAGDAPRYQLYDYHQGAYHPVDTLEHLDKPLLIKPMGALGPERSLILSDADFVDWLTEAVAGFALPPIVKEWRKKRDWLFLGCRFERDTDRMVARELAGELSGGYWLFEGTPTKAETRFVQTHNLRIIPASLAAFLGNGDG
jgi:hypothetical protein